MAPLLHATPAAVVVGGTLEALDGAEPRRPPAFFLSQAEALGRALPGAFVPSELVAAEAVREAAAQQRLAEAGPTAAGGAAAGAAGGGAAPAVAAAGEGGAGVLDCLEACCLRDDLHLFSPAGPTRSLLTWARLPLPLLYEGSQFCYPLRQLELPAPALQLCLNRHSPDGWDSCLWHSNLPMLAARSASHLTLLQLADSSAAGEGQAEGEQPDEWEEDAGGGFELQPLCVVAAASPTAHACWQRHLTQRPLLLLQDGTLLEAQLGQGVQVVEAWRPPQGSLPARLQGALQVAGGAAPRTALLALRDRLCQLDLRASSGSRSSPASSSRSSGGGSGGDRGGLQLLWQCPQGQHLTALCGPPAGPSASSSSLGGDAGSGGSLAGASAASPEHLLAAAVGSGARGSGARLLLFDVRRPGRPVASWEQPAMHGGQQEAVTLLRWLPLAASSPDPFGATQQGQGQQWGGQQHGSSSSSSGGGGGEWEGLLLAGASATGRAVGCQHSISAFGPELLAKEGQVSERPAGSGALLLERLQAALEEQELELQAGRQQAGRQQAGGQQAGGQQAGLNGAAAGEGSSRGSGPSTSHHHQQQQDDAASLVPAPLQPPPPLPLPLQLLWQPARASTTVTAAPGPPLLLLPPLEQQPGMAERLAAGRLLLQKQQAAAGGTIQLSRLPLPGSPALQPGQQQQMLGLAAVAADWRTGEWLPVPVLASLMPHGDASLFVLQSGRPQGSAGYPHPAQQQQQQAQQAQGQGASAAAAAAASIPLLLPAAPAPGLAAGAGGPAAADGSAQQGQQGPQQGPQQAQQGPQQGTPVLPYVPGVPPPQLVAAVAAGELRRCGCCAKCLAASKACLTAQALEQAGLLPQAGPAGRLHAKDRPLLTIPAEEHGRSVVQLPLHLALAQLLLSEHAAQQGQQAGGQQPQQQQQPRRGRSQQQQQQQQGVEEGVSAAALQAVLARLGRPISLQELFWAARLQQDLDSSAAIEGGGASPGGSSSQEEDGSGDESEEEEGGGGAVGLVQRRKAAEERRERRAWQAALRQERREQQQQRERQLDELLAGRPGSGSSGFGAGSTGSRGGDGGQRARGRAGRGASSSSPGRGRGRGRKRKPDADAGLQPFVLREPASPALEVALQRAGLLPLERPRGTAADVEGAPFGPQQQGQQLRPPAGPLALPGPAFRQQVAEAARGLDASSAAAAAGGSAGTAEQATAGTSGGQQAQQGRPKWDLQPRSFSLLPSQPAHAAPAAGGGQQGAGQQGVGQQEPGERPVIPAPQLVVRQASQGAALLTVAPPEQPPAADVAGPSSGASPAAGRPAPAPPLLRLRLPAQVGDEAQAALEQLRQAWGGGGG